MSALATIRASGAAPEPDTALADGLVEAVHGVRKALDELPVGDGAELAAAIRELKGHRGDFLVASSGINGLAGAIESHGRAIRDHAAAVHRLASAIERVGGGD